MIIANGWGRSSAIVVLVLQRASIARRSYATIGHVYASVFGTHDTILKEPTQKDWETLLLEFYKKSKINVDDIYYIEAHGSGIKVRVPVIAIVLFSYFSRKHQLSSMSLSMLRMSRMKIF